MDKGVKISELPETNNVSGNEDIIINQNNNTKRIKVSVIMPDLSEYATEEYVDNEISKVNTSSTPNLDEYATKEYVDNAVPSLDGYATEEYVDNEISKVNTSSTPNLDEYATKEYVDNAVPNLDGYATKEYVNDEITKAVANGSPSSPSSGATQQYVDNEISKITTNKAYVEVTHFGAIADLTTDNSSIFQSLINSGYGLDLQGKTYVVSKTVSVSNLRIKNGKIIGNGAVNCFNIIGGSIVEMTNMEIRDSRYAVFVSTPDSNITIRISDSKFYNNIFTVTNINANHPETHYTIDVTNSEFRNCRESDMYITNAIIDYCNVSDCRFLDGINESLNFAPRKNYSGSYYFNNNKFYNYTNTRSGDDADGHFIRCYGDKAFITNNVFEGLYLGEGVLGNDTEALRPNCHKTVIDSNIFINAGMQEGSVTLKSCNDCVVNNNTFIVTDDYNAIATERGNVTIGVVLCDSKSVVSNNRFVNFNGSCIDSQDSQPEKVYNIEIFNNVFEDCHASTTYSMGSILRITAYKSTDKNIFIRNNKVVRIDPNKKSRMFLYTRDSDNLYIENNDMSATIIFQMDRINNIHIMNNKMSDFERVFAEVSCLKYMRLKGNFYTNVPHSNTSLFFGGKNTVNANTMTLEDEVIEVENFTSQARILNLPMVSSQERYVSCSMLVKCESDNAFMKFSGWVTNSTTTSDEGSLVKSPNGTISFFQNNTNLSKDSVYSPKGLSATNTIILTIHSLFGMTL